MTSAFDSTLVAARATAADPLAKLSIGQIQRWCARENAQLIFNCDGTIYAATAEEVHHRQIHGDTFAVALGRQV